MPDYGKMRKRLAKHKGMAMYTADEIKYLEKPLGKAAYISEEQRKKDKVKANWWDYIKCGICGTVFMRSCRSAHEKTRHHRDFLRFDVKIREIMLK